MTSAADDSPRLKMIHQRLTDALIEADDQARGAPVTA